MFFDFDILLRVDCPKGGEEVVVADCKNIYSIYS